MLKLNSRIHEKVVKDKTGKVKYEYIVIIVDYFGEDGKAKQKQFNTGITIAEYHRGAKRKAEELRIQFTKMWEEELAKQRGLDINYADLTVMQMLKKYTDDVKNGLVKKGGKVLVWSDMVYDTYVNDYTVKLQKFLQKRGQEDIKLADFMDHDAEAFAHFLYNFKTRRGTVITDCTIKKILCFIKPAFKYAKRKKWVKHNAFEDITCPTYHHKKPEFFSNDDFDKLWENLGTHKYGLPVKFAFWTGMRRSEVVGLKWSAVDLIAKQPTAKVREKVLRKKGEGMKAYTKLKTEASERIIPLAPEAVDILSEQRKITEESSKALLYDRSYSDFVFVTKEGKLIQPDRLTETVRTLCAKLGIKGHLHKARHTFATRLRKSGADLKVIQVILGHATYHTTATFYMGVDDEDTNAAISGLSEHFNKEKKGSDNRDKQDGLRIDKDEM